jgi:hypothetical protein
VLFESLLAKQYNRIIHYEQQQQQLVSTVSSSSSNQQLPTDIVDSSCRPNARVTKKEKLFANYCFAKNTATTAGANKPASTDKHDLEIDPITGESMTSISRSCQHIFISQFWNNQWFNFRELRHCARYRQCAIKSLWWKQFGQHGTQPTVHRRQVVT